MTTPAASAEPEPTADSRRSPSPEELRSRLAAGADELTGERPSFLARPRSLVAVAATLMTSGVTLVLLGWLGAARSDYLEQQVPYLISGGLLGVLLGTIGALCLVAHWLTEQLRDQRTNHAALLEAVQALTASVDRLAQPAPARATPRTARRSSTKE